MRRRAAFLTLLLLVSFVAVPVVLTWREVRQERLNQALIAAAGRYDTQAVETLLARGADAHAKAERHSNQPLWRWLWKKLQGQSPPSSAETALLASLHGHGIPHTSLVRVAPDNPRLVRALLDQGAEMNVTDTNGETPLMLAIDNQAVETATLLIDRGADVNRVAAWCSPSTALESAVVFREQGLVQRLLAHGAKMNLKDANGGTAMDYARDNHPGSDAIIQMLQQAAAKEESRQP